MVLHQGATGAATQMLRHAADQRFLNRPRSSVWIAAFAYFVASAAGAQQLFAPAFSSTPVTTASAGAAYSYSITVADLDLLDAIAITAPSGLPQWLTLTDNGNRTATLAGAPGPAEVGPHAVLLQASDGVNIAQQTFTITVLPNNTPLAVNDTYSTAEDTELNVNPPNGVLANDTNAATAQLLAVPTNGTVTLNPNGSFRYVPAANFTGTDTFTYQAVNGAAISNVATVSIQVSSANDAPAANADSYATSEDTQLTVPVATGVLANDVDPEGDALTAQLVDDVDNGTLALNANGSFVYMPNADFNGQDTFTYIAGDGSAQSAAATVTIGVSSGNDVPTAANDTYAVDEDTALTVPAGTGVLSNDTDADGSPLAAVLVGNVSSGTLALAPDGSFTYTPNPGFSGADSFTYQASDGTAVSNTATVTITVSSANDAPTAVADTYTTAEGTVLTVAAANGVLANDTDPENDPLTAVIVSGASSGTATLNGDGSFTYTPAAAFTGAATFTYQANDGPLTSAAATVTINVTAVDDPPVAVADAYTTAEDTQLVVAPALGVLANDTDPDTPPAGRTAELATPLTPGSGSLTLSSNGAFTYSPAANFSGTAAFAYRARDAASPSVPMTVTITVTPVNDLPVVSSAPAQTIAEGVSYAYTLDASDADGDLLAISAPTLPAWLSFTPPATISGTPTQADVGVHSVTMTVTDAAVAVAQTWQITVQSVDNAPVVAPIPAQVATEGTAFSLDLTQFVTDADTPAPSIVYATAGALPAGLALSPAGVLSGTPQLAAAVGEYVVSFTAADGATAVTAQFPLTILRAGRADLAISMSAAPSPVALGAPVTWTLNVANQAQNVEVGSFTLDASFSGDVPFRFDPPTIAGCTATPSGNDTRVLCTLGPLAGGATATVALTGTGAFAGDVFATATVAVNGLVPIDETPGNDRATASLSIAQSIVAAPAQSITGLGARAAAAGDFDGDGFDDLAVTGGNQGTIVLMNVVDPVNPEKRMLATAPLALGGEALANDVAVADLDMDGDADIVTAGAAGTPNRVFLNGGAAFAAGTLANAAGGSRAVAVGDVNGDTFPDVVFAAAGSIRVFLNQGSGGTFGAGTPVPIADATDVAFADFFGDPLPELVVARAGGDAALLRNAGGAFQPELTLASGAATAAAIADFSGDSRNDVVLGRNAVAPPAQHPTNQIWLNTSGTRGELFLADDLGAAATLAVTVNDFDFDGDVDVLAVNPGGAQIYTNTGSGTGTFALHPQQLGLAGAVMTLTGRFSADQRIDVVLVGSGGISVFNNDGAGNFGSGDAAAPTIALLGAPSVTVTVGDAYTDAGATATDSADGDVTSRIKVTNPVDTSVVGTYTVTYSVTDLSGNAATPVTRTVQVQAREAQGGGGGAVGLELLLLGLLSCFAAARRRMRPRY